MNKTGLVSEVRDRTALSQREADECVASFVEFVTNALARGEKVTLVGFGSFTLKHIPARQGRHPRTGETIDVKAHNSVQFNAGAALSDAVR